MTNREAFISEVADRLKMSTANAKQVSDTVIDTLIDCVKKNGKVNFPQKLTFELADRKARVCKNPRTGEEVNVPASKTIRLTLRPAVKEKLNG